MFSHLALSSDSLRLLLTAFVLAGALLGSKGLQRYFSGARAGLPAETRRAALVTSRNALFTLATLLIASLWLAELRSVALSVAAIGTGLLLVGKEIVLGLAGRMIQASTRPFSVGDVIEIGSFSGKVVDIGPFQTTLMEMDAARQYTGATVEFPNLMIVTTTIRNYSRTGRYVIESLRVPVPADADVKDARARLLAATAAVTTGYLAEAVRHLAAVEAEEVLHLPDFRPRVLVEPRDAYQVDLVARFPVPAAERAYVAQDVLTAFYEGTEGTHAPQRPSLAPAPLGFPTPLRSASRLGGPSGRA
jgi:small-conductance mechanosensitive channel